MLLPFLSIACWINQKQVLYFSGTLHKARVQKTLSVTEKKSGKYFVKISEENRQQ